jgi:hypothetical protein
MATTKKADPELEAAIEKELKELKPVSGGKITPSELLEKRTALVNRYGKKIITEPDDSNLLTLQEKVAKVAYEVMSEELHKMAPETIAPDKAMEFYTKQGVDSVFGLVGKYITKIFLVLLAILILLALFRFVFS